MLPGGYGKPVALSRSVYQWAKRNEWHRLAACQSTAGQESSKQASKQAKQTLGLQE